MWNEGNIMLVIGIGIGILWLLAGLLKLAGAAWDAAYYRKTIREAFGLAVHDRDADLVCGKMMMALRENDEKINNLKKELYAVNEVATRYRDRVEKLVGHAERKPTGGSAVLDFSQFDFNKCISTDDGVCVALIRGEWKIVRIVIEVDDGDEYIQPQEEEQLVLANMPDASRAVEVSGGNV